MTHYNDPTGSHIDAQSTTYEGIWNQPLLWLYLIFILQFVLGRGLYLQ